MSTTLFDGVTLTVEAALSAATGTYGAWDASLWDTATWGPDVVWTDISTYVRTIKIDRAFSHEVQAWTAGTAELVLDNRDGRFSPDNLSGPYVTAGVTEVRPGRPVRITATYAGISYVIYYGYVTDWQEDWKQGRTPTQGDAWVTVPCSDEFSRLTAFNGAGVASVGAGEYSGSRVHRLLNAAGHTGPRDIEQGRTTVQATTLSSNTIDELQLTTDSEGGGLWVDADGTVAFGGRYALMENTRSNTVQATFTDDGTGLPYADAKVGSYSITLVQNMASLTRVGGAAQTASDATSRALYGDRQAPARTDLICETDAQVAELAAFLVQRYKDPEKRFTSVLVKPRRSPAALFPHVLGRRVRDLVEVTKTPPGGHTITRDCHIAGVHHVIDKSKGVWETTFDLWSATVYLLYADSRWDVATWDGAAWFF